jgi:hypothetical protein
VANLVAGIKALKADPDNQIVVGAISPPGRRTWSPGTGCRLGIAPRRARLAREAERGRRFAVFVGFGGGSGRTAQASAPVTTVPVATSLEMIAGDTPTAANIVWPNAARLFTGETSPLVDAAPDLESIASAP